MTKSHERMEKSIGCGVALGDPAAHVSIRIKCTRDSGNLCAECQIKRDVLDELTEALADTALIDTMDRMRGRPLREGWRALAKTAGEEVRCST